MKVGDLVKHTHSGCLGVVLRWNGFNARGYRRVTVHWWDGKVGYSNPTILKVVA